VEGRLGTIGPDPRDQRILPDADEHVAVKQETHAAEHLLFDDAATAGQGLTNAGGEGFAVGHGRMSVMVVASIEPRLYSTALEHGRCDCPRPFTLRDRFW
jgi:hypothetical protein